MTILLLRWRALPPPLALRWRGPDSAALALAAAPKPTPLAAIIGPTGPAGPAGGSAAPLQLVSDVSVAAGTPLAVSRSTGHLVKADAASKPLAFVTGLASGATSIGFVADCERSSLTLGDWTAVTGSALLSPGQNYFLASGGGLTLTAPSLPCCVTLVGTAASITTMLIEPQTPIQL